jgi:hypothetical protein
MISADHQWDLVVMVLGTGLAYFLGQPAPVAQNPFGLASLVQNFPQLAKQNAMSTNDAMLKSYNTQHTEWQNVPTDVAAASMIVNKYPLPEGETAQSILNNVDEEWDKYEPKKDNDDLTDEPDKDDLIKDNTNILERNGQGKRDMREYSAYLKQTNYTKSVTLDPKLNLDKDRVHFVSFPWSAEWGQSRGVGIYSTGDFGKSTATEPISLPNGLNVYSFDLNEMGTNIQSGLSVVVCRRGPPCKPPGSLTPYTFVAVKPGQVYYSRDAKAMLQKS